VCSCNSLSCHTYSPHCVHPLCVVPPQDSNLACSPVQSTCSVTPASMWNGSGIRFSRLPQENKDVADDIHLECHEIGVQSHKDSYLWVSALEGRQVTACNSQEGDDVRSRSEQRTRNGRSRAEIQPDRRLESVRSLEKACAFSASGQLKMSKNAPFLRVIIGDGSLLTNR
jgi:hypothetical protein